MQHPFTRAASRCLLMVALFVLSGCASLPLSLISSSADKQGTSAQQAEKHESSEVTSGSSEHFSQNAVEIPSLKRGNQELFERALVKMQAGNFAAAEVLLEALTQSQAELAGPWVNLGFVHLASQDFEAARAAFTQAIQANPHNCDALNQLGVLSRQHGQFEDAEGYYLQCTTAPSGPQQASFKDASLNLAILYELYMGRYGEALAAYQDYQLILAQPDGVIAGWVMDLERRISMLANR